MDENHEKFKERLINSVSDVFIVGEFLHRKGYTIEIPALKIRKEHENPDDFVDDGDIFIIHKNGNKSRIEVKGISTQFTGVHDFPHKFMIVSAKKRIDTIGPSVKRWIILSKDKIHYGSISWKSRETWKPVELYAQNTQKKEWFYVAPLSSVKFGSILI